MLPDVEAQDGCSGSINQRGHKRVILIGSRSNLKITLGIYNQPTPARPKPASSGSIEFFLHSIHRTECGIDRLLQTARRTTSRRRVAHDIPKELMVPVATSIVAQDRGDFNRQLRGTCTGIDIDQTKTLELREFFQSAVEIVDVSLRTIEENCKDQSGNHRCQPGNQEQGVLYQL